MASLWLQNNDAPGSVTVPLWLQNNIAPGPVKVPLWLQNNNAPGPLTITLAKKDAKKGCGESCAAGCEESIK